MPSGLIKKMIDEFRDLKQGRMSGVEYRDRFLTLSRYAPDETDTDAKKKERFLNGLHDEMQTVLVNIPFVDLEALVDSAIQMEGKINQANENRKRRMMHQNGPNNAQKYRTSSPAGRASRPPMSGGNNDNNYNRAPPIPPGNNNNNFNNKANPGRRTGSNAVRLAPRNKSTVTCYECGIVGHYSYECPQKLMKAANNAAPKPNAAAPAQQQHHAAAERKSGPSYPHNRDGRFYHVNAAEAQEAPTTVMGMFSS